MMGRYVRVDIYVFTRIYDINLYYLSSTLWEQRDKLCSIVPTTHSSALLRWLELSFVFLYWRVSWYSRSLSPKTWVFQLLCVVKWTVPSAVRCLYLVAQLRCAMADTAYCRPRMERLPVIVAQGLHIWCCCEFICLLGSQATVHSAVRANLCPL